MKIGIVTYVKTVTCNYGAELQSFALQYILNKHGYDAEVIDLKRKLPSHDKFIETVKKAVLEGHVRVFVSCFFRCIWIGNMQKSTNIIFVRKKRCLMTSFIPK